MTDPANPILATMLQDQYAADRRRYREDVLLPYLAGRELPGTPQVEPVRHDAILGSA